MWPLSRLLHHLPAWIIAADPERAAASEAVARSGRRVDMWRIVDGQCELFGRIATADAAALDHVVTEIAKELPSAPLPEALQQFSFSPELAAKIDLDNRRAAAVGILARRAFGQDALPTHQLIVHIEAADDGVGSVAEVEKWGAVLTAQLPELLAHSKVVVRPVVNPATLPAQDQHDPSELLRFAVCQRNPVDVFPYGSRSSRTCDLDHTEPFTADETPGQTRASNLGPLSRRVHRAKTHGDLHVCQPQPGVFHWRTGMGFEYVVLPSGTIRLGAMPVSGRLESKRPEPPPEPVPDPHPSDPVWGQPPHPETVAWAGAWARLMTLAS